MTNTDLTATMQPEPTRTGKAALPEADAARPALYAGGRCKRCGYKPLPSELKLSHCPVCWFKGIEADATETDAETLEVDAEIASLSASWQMLRRALDRRSDLERAYLLQRAREHYRIHDLPF